MYLPSRAIIKYRADGKKGNRKWKVALSQCTSLCGMPQGWGSYSQTLHRNYLLPISSNLEQNEKDAPMARVEHTSISTPVPSVDSEPVDAEPSGMVASSTAGNTSQGSLDERALLRYGTHTTQNWLLWRYQNFGLLADISQPSIWDAWVGLCICLHFISCLYTIVWVSMV